LPFDRAVVLKRWVPALVALLAYAGGALADDAARVSGPVVQTDQMRAALSAERPAAAPGETLWVAVSLDVKPGWHTYWRTPGDAGEPITITWTLPAGVTAGPTQWPIPERFDYSGIAGFGYTGHAALLTELTIDKSVRAPAEIPLKADVTWLSCADVCIPEEASLSLPVKIEAAGARRTTAKADPAIAAALGALPRPAPWPVKATRSGNTLTLTAGPGVSAGALKNATYFPYDGALIDNGAKQDFSLIGGALELKIELTANGAKHGEAAGVLRLDQDNGAAPVGYSFAAPIVPIQP
jgi:DsbC/DsbD-like thiol-disulfide interchange protein